MGVGGELGGEQRKHMVNKLYLMNRVSQLISSDTTDFTSVEVSLEKSRNFFFFFGLTTGESYTLFLGSEGKKKLSLLLLVSLCL